ncbi:hypothetical protein PHLCEN_2v6162 [Hermanssonia centrifuga]|uniref:Probable RNA-binding protein 18 n=1 Tax=Hermanssonia centrifuga TaxID=98765 RepID=A0A2R6P0A8_9APHY|nr:hypothetical protein PHLCEN_2v6162 [Hermanssonia centrifuga]
MSNETETPFETHLSYPVPSTSSQPSPPPSTPNRQLLRDRLYVGNLHPTVDEYTLVQVFSKFGNISKLDFLFHKTGPMKGKPRGYAFVEYSKQEDAAKALTMGNAKLLRGRKLVVTYAHQAPLDQGVANYGRPRRTAGETGKPTTLSLLKTAAAGRSDATEDKIAKMEAKLRQLGQASPNASSAGHPSLPSKPLGSTFAIASSAGAGKGKSTAAAKATPLPSLPLPNTQPNVASRPSTPLQPRPLSASHHPPMQKKGGSSLIGVKIKKHKES